MSCVSASLRFIVLHRDCGGAPATQVCTVGQGEYANAENTDCTLFNLLSSKCKFPLLFSLELYFPSPP